jgi:hypothetical protein
VAIESGVGSRLGADIVDKIEDIVEDIVVGFVGIVARMRAVVVDVSIVVDIDLRFDIVCTGTVGVLAADVNMVVREAVGVVSKDANVALVGANKNVGAAGVAALRE